MYSADFVTQFIIPCDFTIKHVTHAIVKANGIKGVGLASSFRLQDVVKSYFSLHPITRNVICL